MGSNVGSDSASDAETNEPVNRPIDFTEISDSDDDDVRQATSPNAAKLSNVIEHIGADSDDEQPDPPVDFGEEEEEDDASRPAYDKPVDTMDVDSTKGPENADAKIADQPEKNSNHKDAEEKDSSPAKPKQRAKKAADPSATKTIKKTTTAAKAKSKVSKKAAASKKTEPLLKVSTKTSPLHKSKSTAKTSPKGSPKSQKRVTSKTASKATGKSSPNGKKKQDAKQSSPKSKAAKVKKTIDKTSKQGKEKTLLKQNGKSKLPVKTFSKKTRTDAEKPTKTASTKPQKPTTKKADPSKKLKAKSKGKATRASKEPEEEEGSGNVTLESDGENSEPYSDIDDEDEITFTPSSKLPIIGSLACSSRDSNAQALLDHAVQQLGKYRVAQYGPDSDAKLHAYIISSDTKRGWGLLQALSSGTPLVTAEWLSSSISEGSWQPMDTYRSDRFGKSPRSVIGTDGANRILEGLRIKVMCEGTDTPSVRKLVTLCGARVAETRIDLIINDTASVLENVPNVTKKWLADSVEAGVAVEYQPYVVGSG